MGMLAVEGSYDKMDALLNQNIHPVDILLLMAASEGDKPKIEELLRAGASYTVKDADGRTALDRAANDEIKDFILSFSVQKAWIRKKKFLYFLISLFFFYLLEYQAYHVVIFW